jgi:hypothetical protein
LFKGYKWRCAPNEGDFECLSHRRLAGIETHPDTGETPVPQLLQITLTPNPSREYRATGQEHTERRL